MHLPKIHEFCDEKRYLITQNLRPCSFRVSERFFFRIIIPAYVATNICPSGITYSYVITNKMPSHKRMET